MNTALVIPVGGGREENLTQVLGSVVGMSITPKMIVLVCDGEAAWIDEDFEFLEDLNFRLTCRRYGIMPAIINVAKHEPGREQPRNLGVRVAEHLAERDGLRLSHVWFLDSDCIVSKGTLAAYERANVADPLMQDKRILVGPYDWLSPGYREEPPMTGQDPVAADPLVFEMRDPRWISFNEHPAGETLIGDLSAGLACFSGNLLWPLSEFKRTGGFWNELHHGRCEDGELGIRAVGMRVPIGFVADATAFHLWHSRNQQWAMEANARDVPMLNERHPWMEGRCVCGKPKDEHPIEGCDGFRQAIFVVDEDGKRFNARCVCGWEGNTLSIWEHSLVCPGSRIVLGST